MKTDQHTIAFVRISVGDDDDVKVHTGIGSPFPESSAWNDYLGTGALLSLSNVKNGAETAASEYELTLKIPDAVAREASVKNFYNEARRVDMQSSPVAIYSVSYTEEQQRAGTMPEPALVLCGRVNRLNLRPTGVACTIYTPATLLNKVVGSVARLNPLEHQRYVDATDQALRFITETTSADVYFP